MLRCSMATCHPEMARSGKPLKFAFVLWHMVSMTRISKDVRATPPHRKVANRMGIWPLQDAKARFSELVRRARSDGPQRVTVHGRDEVVVITAEEFRRLKGEMTGAAVVAAMQASPYKEIDLMPSRGPLPVRDVIL
jgi:prevent-host-death family protein